MPHPLRPMDAHLTLHVTSHATGSRLCFPTDDTRELFKSSIARLLKIVPIELHAFALMDNHFHLLLTTRDVGVTAVFMRRLQASHALTINRIDGYRGQLWLDRYHTIIVESERHALHACLYIDANPWRAMLVEHPIESRWTSHRELVMGNESCFITPHQVLLDLGEKELWRKRYNEIMAEYLRRGARTVCPHRYVNDADPLAGLRLATWLPQAV